MTHDGGTNHVEWVDLASEEALVCIYPGITIASFLISSVGVSYQCH